MRFWEDLGVFYGCSRSLRGVLAILRVFQGFQRCSLGFRGAPGYLSGHSRGFQGFLKDVQSQKCQKCSGLLLEGFQEVSGCFNGGSGGFKGVPEDFREC